MNEIYPQSIINLGYHYFHGLFQNGTFKSYYVKKCNDVFKRNGERLGIYGFWWRGTYGILNEYLIWCWRNTVNTHPYCTLDLFYLYKHFKGETLNYDNQETLYENIDKLFDFVDENFDLFFTPNIEEKYFKSFWRRCNKSWGKGQITTIAVMYKLREIFPDCKITKMDFSIMRGDGEDFKGIDIIFYNDCNEKITIQVKSGKIIETNEIGYVIQSSVNDLKSEADYYCFVDITDNNIKIVTFQNLKPYIIRGNPNHTFRKEILQPIQIDEHMKTPETLQKIAEFVYTKPDLIFELQYVKSDTNLMEIKDKVINVIIGNFLDENLPNQLSEFLNELEQRFQ
jgi:hypothetical protein